VSKNEPGTIVLNGLPSVAVSGRPLIPGDSNDWNCLSQAVKMALKFQAASGEFIKCGLVAVVGQITLEGKKRDESCMTKMNNVQGGFGRESTWFPRQHHAK
jgi:hypothetical protein